MMKSNFQYMENCIHLKACRRLQNIGKKYGCSFPRRCTEKCTAYRDSGEVKDQIWDCLRWAFQKGKDGDDWLIWKNPETVLEWLKGGEQNDQA